jgi:hypothetical protein
MQSRILKSTTSILLMMFMSVCYSDGSSIDKVYLPYVQPLEKEIETRLLVEKDNVLTKDTSYLNKTAYGMALNEKLFSEIYVVTQDDKQSSPKTYAYEIEMRYQLTEQGEYSIDFGSMLEIENYAHKDIWEVGVGLLASGQWKNTVNTANIFIINEWGKDIKSEIETAFSFQSKYRLSSFVEPGFEVYLSQETTALGPIIMGSFKTLPTHKLFWHLGVIKGYDPEIPDKTYKFQLEYEFL